MVKFIITIILLFLAQYATAQVAKSAQINSTERQRLFDKLEQEIYKNLPPYNAASSRLAVMLPEFNTTQVSPEDAQTLRLVIESALQTTAFKLIFIPEFQEYKRISLKSFDSTVVFEKTTPSKLLRSNSALLDSIVLRHSIHSILYMNIQFDDLLGYQLGLQLVNMSSKETIWTKIINSPKPQGLEKYTDGSFTFGFCQLRINSINAVSLPSNAQSSQQLFFSYNWRQYFNQSKSFIFSNNLRVNGLTINRGGFDFVKIVPEFNSGLGYAFLNKPSQKEFWFEYHQMAGLAFYPSVNPIIRTILAMNLTRNMTLSAEIGFTTDLPTFKRNNIPIEINPFSYGLQVTYRP
jgi:hypothetical protein